MNCQGKSIPGGRNKEYKGPEARKGLDLSDNKIQVSGGQRVRLVVEGDGAGGVDRDLGGQWQESDFY